ncbi:hypothetical protein BN168_560010 [Clostridioides difficile CD002]|nr:hypothetical protein BN168_560010 [Clostridioides difficile CD002]
MYLLSNYLYFLNPNPNTLRATTNKSSCSGIKLIKLSISYPPN